MKRRKFIKGMGLSTMAVTSIPVHGNLPVNPMTLPDYNYGDIGTLENAVSQEGLHIIRLAMKNNPKTEEQQLSGKIKVKNAGIERIRSYFFGNNREVVVLWLKDASEKSTVGIKGPGSIQFSLGELINTGELVFPIGGVSLSANFLLDRELGEITLSEFGASEPGEDFSFVAMADPQGGDPEGKDPKNPEKLLTRMKIHNAFIEESVDLANRLDFNPLFTVVAGDVCDDWGYEKDLARMNTFLSRLNSPVLYGIGNHETLLRSEFGPGYNMDAFSNFLSAQKAMNGLDKLLYSFNAGKWHFIVWPDPLRNNFWETHPHYFDWLERDLEKYRERPTMLFQHVPIQPIGITPHINYAESVGVRKTFLDILTRHGNVKYILSGHVHIPVKASFKTAISMRGIKLINLPAAGYRPRSFGEEDFYGGPSQGIGLVHIRGKEATIQYKTVTEELFEYPAKLPEFDEEAYPLWLSEKWELPAATNFVNGSFENELSGWAKRYIYTEDIHPSNRREAGQSPGTNGTALYLSCKRRGYQAPGQDRLPQDINRLSQAVKIERGSTPTISFSYRVDGEYSDPEAFAGGYILVEGYSGSKRVHKLMYSAGKIWVNTWGARNLDKNVPFHHFGLDNIADTWHKTSLNIARDFEKAEAGKSYSKLQADRLVVTLGVWNINDGGEQPFGIYFTNLSLSGRSELDSNTDGIPIPEKDEKDIWWLNKLWPWKHAAGEHRYIIATQPGE